MRHFDDGDVVEGILKLKNNTRLVFDEINLIKKAKTRKGVVQTCHNVITLHYITLSSIM